MFVRYCSKNFLNFLREKLCLTFFSSNKVSNNIPSEVVNNSTTYAGVKVYDTTYNYFANATEHFSNATEAAASCAGYATLTAAHAAQTAMQGVLGLCAYKEFAGYLMTGHAFGFAVPAAVGGILGGIATTMVSHPTAFMAGFVTAAIAVSPENAIETVKDAACTVIKAAEFVYHDAAGILNAAAGIGHLVYDNLPSYSEVTPVVLAGSMEISWVDAVA